jgi:hypothetical protein
MPTRTKGEEQGHFISPLPLNLELSGANCVDIWGGYRGAPAV